MGRAVNMSDNVVEFRKYPSVTVLPVLEADFDEFLPRGLDLIAPAVERQSSDVSVEDIDYDLRQGGSVMWIVHVEDTLVAALTTCVVRHPQRNTLKIEFMGGTKMRLWMGKVVGVLSELAKKADLGAIEADGRKGFERYVDQSPFSEVYTHYVMELD